MTARLALTPGEPAGIGPDLALALSQQPPACEWVCFSNAELLQTRAKTLGLAIELSHFDATQAPRANHKGQIKLVDVPMAETAQVGKLNPANAHFVLESIQQAAQACMAGTFDALVTGPIHKGVINDANISFSGHTEFLQTLTKRNKVVMMLANQAMRVALVTTHLPLKDVARHIDFQTVTEVLDILHQTLQQDFGLSQPHILVTGLNPHAGESGHMGDEEITTLIPAIRHCQKQGMHLSGPLPADTLFTEKYLSKADAVLAMYHDQGLPVLKYAGFGNSVNITLGLPFIRTSVDHGTALDLAGSGQASIGSLQAAIAQALKMATHHAHRA